MWLHKIFINTESFNTKLKTENVHSRFLFTKVLYKITYYCKWKSEVVLPCSKLISPSYRYTRTITKYY